MPEIINREDRPVPGIDYSEIHINDENDLGTGYFIIMLEPKAFSKNNPIISTIANEPHFMLVVSMNIATEEVTAVLGEAYAKSPRSRKVFTIPKDINVEDGNEFIVNFANWEVQEMKLNGAGLKEAE